MDLKPLGDRIIVEVLEEEQTTVSGIVLPDTAQEKPQRAKVLAVGPGRYEDGQLVPLDVAVGDEVVFSKYGGTEVKFGVDEYLILRESRRSREGRVHQGQGQGQGLSGASRSAAN